MFYKEKFKNNYFKYLELLGYEASFLTWFKKYISPRLNISKETKTWETTHGKFVTSMHPPLRNIFYGNM